MLLLAGGCGGSGTVATGPGEPLIEGDITPEHPFGTESLYRLGTDGKTLIDGHTDSLRFRYYSLSGKRIRRVGLSPRPISLREEDMEEWMEDVASEIRSEYLEGMRNAEIDTQPLLSDFLVDDDEGRLWIDVNDALEAKSVWLVVSRDGVIISKHSFPKNVYIKVVRDGKAYGVRFRETDAQEIVVYDTRTAA